MSPTARSLKQLREDGYTCQVVEHYNKFARRRVDLFQVIDIVAVKEDEQGVLGIQATTTGHISDRKKKALATPELSVWLRAGNRFEIWGWAKRGPRKTYQLKVVSLTVSDTVPQSSKTTTS